MKELFAITAALFTAAGNTPYVWRTVRGDVRPHPYTWLVWAIVSGIVFFGQVAKGAGLGALPTAVSGLFATLIFLLSLRRGFEHVHRSDAFFLVLALAGIVPWTLTNDPTWSVIIAVLIDLSAFVPTFRKAWRRPKTEEPVLYGANVLRHSFALVSLQTYNVATALHAVAMIVANGGMTAFLLWRRHTRFPRRLARR